MADHPDNVWKLAHDPALHLVNAEMDLVNAEIWIGAAMVIDDQTDRCFADSDAVDFNDRTVGEAGKRCGYGLTRRGGSVLAG